jgi:hypothetical protein
MVWNPGIVERHPTLCQGRKSRGELTRVHLVRSKVCFSASVSTEIHDQERENRTVSWTSLILLTREFYGYGLKCCENMPPSMRRLLFC